MTVKCQLVGVLSKRPFGRQSNAWQKRFFVIKDGFVCYYAETERKEFERTKKFNIHPKGIVPLANSDIAVTSEPGHPYAFTIQSDDILTPVALTISADSEFEREKWIEALRQAARVTWDNATMGDSLIKQWEDTNSRLEHDRQRKMNELMDTSEELANEQMKSLELRKLTEELEMEKAESEKILKELQETCQELQRQLSLNRQTSEQVENDKRNYSDETHKLQEQIEQLSQDHKKVMKDLRHRENESTKLYMEKDSLNSQTQELQQALAKIEAQQKKLEEDKKLAETSLENHLARETILHEEKLQIAKQMEELQFTIKDLHEQKQATERELQEEVKARLEAEAKLRAAESSLANLDKAIDSNSNLQTSNPTLHQEMKSDVKTLKRYFENVAFNAKVDANTTNMIKTSLNARREFTRKVASVRMSTLSQINTAKSGLSVRGKQHQSQMPGNNISSVAQRSEITQANLARILRKP